MSEETEYNFKRTGAQMNDLLDKLEQGSIYGVRGVSDLSPDYGAVLLLWEVPDLYDGMDTFRRSISGFFDGSDYAAGAYALVDLTAVIFMTTSGTGFVQNARSSADKFGRFITCIHDGKPYIGIQFINTGCNAISKFSGFISDQPVFEWVYYEYCPGSNFAEIINQEVYNSIVPIGAFFPLL